MTDLEWPGPLDEDDAVEYTLTIYGPDHDHQQIEQIVVEALERIEALTGTDVHMTGRIARGVEPS